VQQWVGLAKSQHEVTFPLRQLPICLVFHCLTFMRDIPPCASVAFPNLIRQLGSIASKLWIDGACTVIRGYFLN
jgi:hypothetical protein